MCNSAVSSITYAKFTRNTVLVRLSFSLIACALAAPNIASLASRKLCFALSTQYVPHY
ncbi:hypothetical protein BDV29DRAFT_170004 [Aspergillus leporis]|uniref:Uncharacterized protein n=1 Tax=Aspergillus leporis TaxID=41062 RepID=A0A5N5XB37_9EURO|nr:hypothetical protein BDV29DRAFT_170004 [Aspergillus leporis]